MEVADGVRTVGELEVMEHLRAGLRIVDARTPGWFERGTIPGADNNPHTDVVDRMAELNPSEPTIFFCNGPQCAQSPWAIEALLEAGHPAEAILYYRGGMHDWLTLGLPVSRP
jgi:rhodanese-related sulfurtransferase